MSYMNRPHSAELTRSLKNHGMDITRPSQLSDAFRLGWWAAEKEAKQQRADLMDALKLIANAENSALDLAYCKGIARAAIANATKGAA